MFFVGENVQECEHEKTARVSVKKDIIHTYTRRVG